MARKQPVIKIDDRKAFADHYPVNIALWTEMEDVSIEGATLLTFGIDANAIACEFDGTGEPVGSEQLPVGFFERMEIINSAVRTGSLSTTVGSIDRVKLADFSEWSQRKGYRTPLAGAIPVSVHTTKPQRKIEVRSTNWRPRDWDPLIIAAIEEYEQAVRYTPDADELWAKLHTTPPKQYGITSSGSDLKAAGLTTTLDKRRLKRRYNLFYP